MHFKFKSALNENSSQSSSLYGWNYSRVFPSLTLISTPLTNQFSLIMRSSYRGFQIVWGFFTSFNIWAAVVSHLPTSSPLAPNEIYARGYTLQLIVWQLITQLLSGTSASWGGLSLSVDVFVLKSFYWHLKGGYKADEDSFFTRSHMEKT